MKDDIVDGAEDVKERQRLLEKPSPSIETTTTLSERKQAEGLLIQESKRSSNPDVEVAEGQRDRHRHPRVGLGIGLDEMARAQQRN